MVAKYGTGNFVIKPILTSAAMTGPAVAAARASPPSSNRRFMFYLPICVASQRSDTSLTCRNRRISLSLGADDQRHQFLLIGATGPELADLLALTEDDRSVGEFNHVFHVV